MFAGHSPGSGHCASKSVCPASVGGKIQHGFKQIGKWEARRPPDNQTGWASTFFDEHSSPTLVQTSRMQLPWEEASLRGGAERLGPWHLLWSLSRWRHWVPCLYVTLKVEGAQLHICGLKGPLGPRFRLPDSLPALPCGKALVPCSSHSHAESVPAAGPLGRTFKTEFVSHHFKAFLSLPPLSKLP